MPQPIEETLAERWVLVEKIDEGAMGEIFRARHAVLGHAVAVKVLIPTVSRDTAAIDRFLREARIAARLQHRNVVRVEDFGIAEDGRPFLVMELLRGESLAKRLAREPRITHAEALEIVRQIAAAVDTAHAAGIVHRDLKPENVFLARDDRGETVLKVLDFGVAKFTDVLANGGNATASNTLIGTPRYMSPEQARSSRELDGRSDLWSLGMIAYEMLTGTHPFDGEAIAELLVAILMHRIPPPSSVRAELPAALDVWVSKALARSRYDRFATGRELADALADALDGRLDERWAGDIDRRTRERDEPGRTTLRVRNPAVEAGAAEEAHGPAEPTPREMPVAITVPTLPAPSSRVEASRSRASWWLAAAVAVVAGLSLIAALRGNARSVQTAPVATSTQRLPSATAPGAALTPVPSAVTVVAPAPELTTPRAETPPVAPVEPTERPSPRRRGTASRQGRGHAHTPEAQPNQTPPTSGPSYDPHGI